MNRVVRILMERDGLTESEAQEVLTDVCQMMADCNYDPSECEQIFLEELGLELDYLFDVI